MEASGCPGRPMEVEDGLYLPEPDRASLHDSEGLLNVHTFRAKVLKLVVSVSRETTNRKLSGNYISIVPGSRMCWFSWFWRICRTN